MTIVVTSDCHGHKEVLKEISRIHPDADFYLDAGDSECMESELDPFITVRGNCDRYIKQKSRIINAGILHIYLFHGNQIPLSLESLSKLATANNCQLLIHGHTHIPISISHNGVQIVCPGSVSYPRSEKGRTYCVIRTDDHRITDIDFYKVAS